MIKISFRVIALNRHRLLLSAFIGTLTLTSCATSSSPSLPVQGGGKSGSVSGVRTYESHGKIMVIGRARVFPSPGNHVDVKLVTPDGRVVAEQTERLELGHPRGTRARHGTAPFVAGFPLESARGAMSVIVSYHHGSHANCPAARG